MASGDKVQLIIPAGGPTSADDVSLTNPLPVTLAAGGATSAIYTEDTAHSSGGSGVAILGVHQDTNNSAKSSVGDYEMLGMSNGALWVRLATDGASVNVQQAATQSGTQRGIPVFGVRKDVPVNIGADNSWEAFQVSNGKLWTNAMGVMVTKSFTATRASAEHAAYAANQLWSDTASGAAHDELTRAQATLSELADGNAQLRRALDATMAERAALLGSTSWRLTAPLRAVSDRIRRARRDPPAPQKT